MIVIKPQIDVTPQSIRLSNQTDPVSEKITIELLICLNSVRKLPDGKKIIPYSIQKGDVLETHHMRNN